MHRLRVTLSFNLESEVWCQANDDMNGVDYAEVYFPYSHHQQRPPVVMQLMSSPPGFRHMPALPTTPQISSAAENISSDAVDGPSVTKTVYDVYHLQTNNQPQFKAF